MQTVASHSANRPFCTFGASSPARSICRCASTPEQKRQTGNAAMRRRSLLIAPLVAYTLQAASGSQGYGLESIPSPFFKDGPGPASKAAEAIKSKAEAATEAFEKSDFLKGLKEKSELNKDKNKKALQDKYCYRQAELGIGDCAGLRLIPGATKSGLQKEKTPERKLLEFFTGGGKTEE